MTDFRLDGRQLLLAGSGHCGGGAELVYISTETDSLGVAEGRK